MTRPVQHKVVALFDRRGESVPRVVIGHKLYEQDQIIPDPLCIPLPPNAICAICAGEGCECNDPGAAHEPTPHEDIVFRPRLLP
ncbi:MAG: hypothetical protein NVSMB20_05310 [Bradyrhizobium sp.]